MNLNAIRYSFTKPLLKKWRTVRSDSTNEKQVVSLVKTAFKEGGCVVVDSYSRSMALVDTRSASRRKGVESVFFHDKWEAERAIDSFMFKRLKTKPKFSESGGFQLKAGRATTGYRNTLNTLIGAEELEEWDNKYDLDALSKLASVFKAREATNTVVNDLDMLVRAMLGQGFVKRQEHWGYRNEHIVTMEYKDVTLTITSKARS